MQNGKVRTSCCSWIVVKFWYQLVFCIATARLIKYLFESSNRAKLRAGTGRPARFNKIPKQKQKGGLQAGNGRPLARPSGMVGGVHRQSTGHRSACARTRFSGLRFGTPYESGIKIKEAQFLYSLSKRPKLRSMLADQDDKGSLQKTHWRSSPRAEKFGDLTTADHKVLDEESESRNNHRFVVVVQDLATQWIQSYPCRNRTWNGVYESFSSRQANPVKIHHGITELQHLIDLRRTAVLKELYAE